MKKSILKKLTPLLIAMVLAPFLMGPDHPFCPDCSVNLVPIEVAVKSHGTGSLVTVLIKNSGPEASKDFWVDIFVMNKDEQKVEKTSEHYIWNHGVNGKSVEAITLYLPQSPKELEWLDVIVDSTDMVSEMNEKDNVAEFDLRGGVR